MISEEVTVSPALFDPPNTVKVDKSKLSTNNIVLPLLSLYSILESDNDPEPIDIGVPLAKIKLSIPIVSIVIGCFWELSVPSACSFVGVTVAPLLRFTKLLPFPGIDMDTL